MEIRWGELETLKPDLAVRGGALLYQFGVGLAFLGTVRNDGGPRVHPMCPILHEDGLYAFITPSPKLADLRRDGRYALHSFGPQANDDEFYLTGRVVELQEDDPRRRPIRDRFRAERGIGEETWDTSREGLFELLIDCALLTTTTGHGDPHPQRDIWNPATRP